MATIVVSDRSGAAVTVELPLAPGTALAAASRPVTLSTENLAVLGAVAETAPTTDILSSGLNGRLQRIAQNLTTISLAQASTTASQKGLLVQGAVTTAAPSYTTAQTSPLSLDTAGRIRGTVTLTDGTTVVPVKAAATAAVDADAALVMQIHPRSVNVNGQAVMASSTPVVGASDWAPNWPKSLAVTNGETKTRIDTAATTNATLIKASAGSVGKLDLFNMAAYDVFFKFFNLATLPVPGTSTPVWTIPVKAGSGFSRDFQGGEFFAVGIGYAITKLQADLDTTAVAIHDAVGRISWI